jgi:hypothetical protein
MSRFAKFLPALVLAVLGLAGTPALAQSEHYFVAVYGYQNGLNTPSSTHSFAAFVRTDGSAQRNILEVKTISWLPADLSFTIFESAEPGVNLTLGQTLGLAAQAGHQVQVFGPYEINADLYSRASRQYANLMDAQATGRILYKSADGGQRAGIWSAVWGAAVNCIHALTDVIGYVETGAARGVEASGLIVQLYWPYVLDGTPQTWLLARLR